MEDLKILVIGCGRIGAEPSTRLEGELPHGWLPVSHLESWLSIKNLGHIAICDPIEEALQRCRELYPIRTCFADHRFAMEHFKPDIISLATRTPVKAEIIKDALKLCDLRGLYIEKPIANSLIGAEKTLNQLSEFNCALAYGANRRHHYLYKKAKELLAQGTIGQVGQIIIEHGAAHLMWTHPHTADLIDFFSDSSAPVKITSQLRDGSLNSASGLTIDGDPLVRWGVIELENGIEAIITSAEGHNIRIHGSDGIMTVHSNGEFITVYSRRHGDRYYYSNFRQYSGFPAESSTVCAFRGLINSIESRIPTKGDHIMNGMKMLMGLAWSHINNGRPIAVDSVPLELTIMGKSEGKYA